MIGNVHGENKYIDSSLNTQSLWLLLKAAAEERSIDVISSTLEDLFTVSEELKSINLILFARRTDVPKNADEEDIVRAMDFLYLENLIFAALKIYPKVILAYEIGPATPQVKEALNNPEMLRFLQEKNNSENTKAVLESFIKLKETFGDKVEIEPIDADPEKVVENTLRLIEENKNNNVKISYRDEGNTHEIHEISGPAVIFYIDLEEAVKIVKWVDTTKIFVFGPPYKTQDEDQDDLSGAMRE
ncbi:MAG: hypothetical protein RXO35_01715 [Candidatus Micrarchaeota archaeon]